MTDRTHHRRLTWTDDAGQQWRAEHVAGRWQLARWAPESGTGRGRSAPRSSRRRWRGATGGGPAR